mmetsp:Transcript_9505/g.13081  ORF Transcript_9505/g.13081 Transcript_9505/m.13081 type:complete len:312 (-) Transcript_9505:152-1087(-)|eukprot:CAMPEP_0185269960 /NCGR_PEP_ID=MMETSP1359-20130426/41174_1 /TAXON_ID=552665 /ORGANISM="Bigelowiella longifila, Strain CCMP242" /LENGTH=311 /DNA_ID=CAMNT_0027861355 /DNA_START=36 /DNA_END=971 /DNA_ORIENTATION=-
MTIYGDWFSARQREEYCAVVRSKTVLAMRDLVKAAENLLESEKDEKYRLKDENAQHVSVIKTSNSTDMPPDVAASVISLWIDPAIKATWTVRDLMPDVWDTADYFFDKAEEVGLENYVPSENDILRVRNRTTGVIENQFTIHNSDFALYDVGGQRSERKKWIHCFEDVTCVLFVANLSGYNQVLWEDGKTNRLSEALHLFGDISNSRWFAGATIVLFLNKVDIYKEKFSKFPITVCPDLADFEGDTDDFEETSDFIQEKFFERIKDKAKRVHSHLTCACDKENVLHVFEAVKDTVLRQGLQAAGLIDSRML